MYIFIGTLTVFIPTTVFSASLPFMVFGFPLSMLITLTLAISAQYGFSVRFVVKEE